MLQKWYLALVLLYKRAKEDKLGLIRDLRKALKDEGLDSVGRYVRFFVLRRVLDIRSQRQTGKNPKYLSWAWPEAPTLELAKDLLRSWKLRVLERPGDVPADEVAEFVRPLYRNCGKASADQIRAMEKILSKLEQTAKENGVVTGLKALYAEQHMTGFFNDMHVYVGMTARCLEPASISVNGRIRSWKWIGMSCSVKRLLNEALWLYRKDVFGKVKKEYVEEWANKLGVEIAYTDESLGSEEPDREPRKIAKYSSEQLELGLYDDDDDVRQPAEAGPASETAERPDIPAVVPKNQDSPVQIYGVVDRPMTDEQQHLLDWLSDGIETGVLATNDLSPQIQDKLAALGLCKEDVGNRVKYEGIQDCFRFYGDILELRLEDLAEKHPELSRICVYFPGLQKIVL